MKKKKTDENPKTYDLIDKPLKNLGGCYSKLEICRDITEPKWMESNLRRLITVVSDSNDAITVHLLDGKITAWNKGAEKMYGYTEAEVVTKMNIAEIVPDDKKKETLTLLEHIKAGELGESIETKRVTKDGRILDVWLTLT